MPTAYSTLLGLALPVTGELTGTWGDVVNDEITELVEAAIAGSVTLSADADVTLTTTTGAANQARGAILLWTAANAVNRNITAPAASKAYLVVHAGGAGTITVRGVGPTAGITLTQGEKCVVVWNGTDFVKASSSALTGLSGILTVPGGGTGAATLTGLVKGNGAGAMTAVTAPTGAVVGTTDTQTLSAKTLTLPQINDTSSTHQYVFGVNELAANRTVTLPLLTASDVFVFADFIQTLTNKTLTNPTITNYVETLFSANTSTAITLNLANGTVQNITSTGNATVTMPAAVAGKSFIMLRRSGTGGFTITWSTVNWPGGVAPTLTATASKLDIFSFSSDGTRWYGTTFGLNYSV